MRSTQERHSFEGTVFKSRGKYGECCIGESRAIAEWNKAIFGDITKPNRS